MSEPTTTYTNGSASPAPSTSSIFTSTSNGSPHGSVLDIIAANDLTHTANSIYSFFAVLGICAGCFVVFGFVQTFRAQRQLAWLDSLLLVFCGLQLLLLLLSLHAALHRPGYMQSSALGCAALSFAVNAASLCGSLVLTLMASVLMLDPPCNAPLRKPAVCAALVTLTSALTCLLLAGLRGLQDEISCRIDPPAAGVAYATTKLSLATLVPFTLQLVLLVGGCARQWGSNGRFLSGSEESPVFLAAVALTFLCQLFYGAALVRGARLARRGEESPAERAVMSVAECVLFSGSSFSLTLVLLLHRPSRSWLCGALRQLRGCCGRRGGAQPNRNIIAPHIEISDTLQDMES